MQQTPYEGDGLLPAANGIPVHTNGSHDMTALNGNSAGHVEMQPAQKLSSSYPAATSPTVVTAYPEPAKDASAMPTHINGAANGSAGTADMAVQRTTFKAQANALLRKSTVYQRRNCGSNCCLLSAPIFFCVLLLVIQTAVNRLLLTGENFTVRSPVLLR